MSQIYKETFNEFHPRNPSLCIDDLAEEETSQREAGEKYGVTPVFSIMQLASPVVDLPPVLPQLLPLQ